MRIEYIVGDLVQSSEYVIAHGCNAQGVMKSGIAKTIRESYPTAYDDYRRVYESQGNRLYLGQVIETRTPFKIILNIISQQYYGRNPNVVYVNYDAIMDAIFAINSLGYDRVAFPKIGAGLANGDWNIISGIIETYSEFQPVVYYLENPTEKW